MSDDTKGTTEELLDIVEDGRSQDIDYVEPPEGDEVKDVGLTVLDAEDLDVIHKRLGFGLAAGVRKYRKRPVVIEAAQWDGSAQSAADIINWVDAGGGTANYACTNLTDEGDCTDDERDHALVINTIEGNMQTKPGGYVIRGLAGEFYPHDPDPLWSKAYEPDDE